MSAIKSTQEIAIMRAGGQKLGQILQQLLDQVKPGVTGSDIDRIATDLIKAAGGAPSFLTVPGYHWATCVSVNEGVVHGIPTDVPFAIGDVVSVDIGMIYEGYHTDTSWTKYLKPQSPTPISKNIQQFLDTGEAALQHAFVAAHAGNRIGHISQAIQQTVERGGYHVVKNLVGHAIGKKLHEEPQVPGILSRSIERTPRLEAGMTFAIEIIYAMGSADITYANDDDWTLATADGSVAGLFEHTVVITDKQPVVLTQMKN